MSILLTGEVFCEVMKKISDVHEEYKNNQYIRKKYQIGFRLIDLIPLIGIFMRKERKKRMMRFVEPHFKYRLFYVWANKRWLIKFANLCPYISSCFFLIFLIAFILRTIFF